MPAKVPITDWRKQEFLGWLCTIKEDRDPPTQKAFAEKIAVPEQTLKNWKSDPEFLEAWEHYYRRSVGSPERMQRVLDMLYETAVDRSDPRQVPAAKEYRVAVEGVRPQQVEVSMKGSAKDLSDDELTALLAASAQSEIERRA